MGPLSEATRAALAARVAASAPGADVAGLLADAMAVEDLAERCRADLDALPAASKAAAQDLLASAHLLVALAPLGAAPPALMRGARWAAALQRLRDEAAEADDAWLERAEWALRRLTFDPLRPAREAVDLAGDSAPWRLLVVPTFSAPWALIPVAVGAVRLPGGAPVAAPPELDAWVAEAAARPAPLRAGLDGVMVGLETAERERVAWCPKPHTPLGRLYALAQRVGAPSTPPGAP
ncbi:MAG: hypothetical protein H6706_17050 [Myxococcales bacterium]|nr:hypothetical protein [Myxococcales bacterium]